jgi:hypothetical protein
LGTCATVLLWSFWRCPREEEWRAICGVGEPVLFQ